MQSVTSRDAARGAAAQGQDFDREAQETELKLRLPASQAQQIWKAPVLSRLLAGKPSRRKLFSAYFDTPGLDLRNHGIALRLRRQGRRWIQTLKSSGSSAGGLQQRAELEVTVPGATLDLRWLTQVGLPALTNADIPTSALGIIFTTEFDRSATIVEPSPGTKVEVCVDKGAAIAGRKRDEFCEIELELKQGELAPLFNLAQELAEVVQVHIEPVSKAQRGYRMVTHERPAPVKAHNPDLAGAGSVDTVFTTLALGCIGHLQANEAGALHCSDVEYLHQARIALRRLRSVFSVCASAVPKSHFSEQRAWLREVNRVLGEARDWDVFMTEFLPAVSGDPEQHPELVQLLRHGARLRAAARRRVRTVLAGSEYTVGMLRLTHRLLAQGWIAERSAEEQELAELSPRNFAVSAVDRAHHKVIRQSERIGQNNQQQLHQLRIRIKKLRYTAELLSPLFARKPVGKYLSRLKALQTVLGHLNDAANTARLLDQLAALEGRPARLQTISYLRGYAAARSHFFETQFQPAWKKFAAAKAFW